MDIDLPIRGLDKLEPLGAYLILYLFFLIVLRLFLWPALVSFRRRGTIARLVRTLLLALMRLAAFGFLLLAFLWALGVLGLQEGFYEMLADLPDLDFSIVGVVVPGVILLLLLVIYFVIRPAFQAVRSPTKK